MCAVCWPQVGGMIGAKSVHRQSAPYEFWLPAFHATVPIESSSTLHCYMMLHQYEHEPAQTVIKLNWFNKQHPSCFRLKKKTYSYSRLLQHSHGCVDKECVSQLRCFRNFSTSQAVKPWSLGNWGYQTKSHLLCAIVQALLGENQREDLSTKSHAALRLRLPESARKRWWDSVSRSCDDPLGGFCLETIRNDHQMDGAWATSPKPKKDRSPISIHSQTIGWFYQL